MSNKTTLNGRPTDTDDDPHGATSESDIHDTAAPADTAADADAPGAASVPAIARPGALREPWRLAAAGLLIVLIVGGLLGYFRYTQTAGELAALRQVDTDRAAAAQTASDYATKSLTYSFEDPDAFFRAVEDGVSAPLKDKYVNANELLTGIMLQAQVTSFGEVLATDVTSNADNTYQVVVSASQTTRNLQNPQPKVSLILLQITLTKTGANWQVTDIGPKTGSRPPAAGPTPNGPAAAPGPGNAPATAPTPPR